MKFLPMANDRLINYCGNSSPERCNAKLNVTRSGNRGFTLLELMISILLLAVIVSIAGLAMRLACRSVSAGETKIERLERFRSSLSIIEAQLQSRIPLVFIVDSNRQSSFSGDRATLQFATNHSIWNGRQGYVLVKYQVESDKNGKKFLRAAERIIGVEKPNETILFNNLDDISFEYFFKDVTGEGKWLEGVPQELVFPEKTRVNMVYEAKKYSFVIISKVMGSAATPGTAFSGRL